MEAIIVESYNPDWTKRFESIKNKIWPLIHTRAASIEHVGSTAVEGLAAKPTIDIDIIVDSVRDLAFVINALESLGYNHRGNGGIEGREAFRVPKGDLKHNLYVCTKDSMALKNHLFLRDYLRQHPATREAYSELKRTLAAQVNSIDEYVAGKTVFILEILKKSTLSAKELDSIVKSNEESQKRLVIKSESQTAELWEADRILKIYSISTAKNGLGAEENSLCTPLGRLKIASKIGYGLPLGSVLRSRIPTGEIWSEDTDNPLSQSQDDLVLTRLLWLEGAEDQNANTFKRHIYLHGTNRKELLGTPCSHGCIRFSNEDILEIFDALQGGSEVTVK